MTASIRELRDVDELAALAELFAVVWGRAGDPPIGSDVLTALAHSRNYVAGAYEGTRLAGGLVGWFGGDPRAGLHLHSHILGVLPGVEARGLGFELKQHQRRWCLERGVTVMEWTTDPLVRRNAYFNLSKLGATAADYLVNVYGTMRDGINAGEESDRLLIRWRLDSEEANNAAAGRVRELEADGDEALVVGSNGEPVSRGGRADVLRIQVPDDIVELRRANPATAREWRMSLRRVMRGALDRGYVIKGMSRSGWYVLTRL